MLSNKCTAEFHLVAHPVGHPEFFSKGFVPRRLASSNSPLIQDESVALLARWASQATLSPLLFASAAGVRRLGTR